MSQSLFEKGLKMFESNLYGIMQCYFNFKLLPLIDIKAANSLICFIFYIRYVNQSTSHLLTMKPV